MAYSAVTIAQLLFPAGDPPITILATIAARAMGWSCGDLFTDRPAHAWKL